MSSFDRRFYDKWYRTERHRVRTPAQLRRHLALAVATAEQLLERPVRRVLDVGAGEGDWGVALRSLRPRATYVGLESSAYVLGRYGKRRGIELGTFGTLDQRRDLHRYDLVLCVDVLHYLERTEVVRGVAALGAELRGVALLHLFAREDRIEGDVHGMRRQSARWYRDTFKAAGLTATGLGHWVGPSLAENLASLER